MACFRSGVPGSALLLTAIVVAPACADDPAPDQGSSGGSGGSAGSSKGGSSGKAGSTGDAGAAGAAGAGTRACAELGELCHEGDTGTGTAAECHELGHVGNGPGCLERYQECIDFCFALGHGGAAHGGAGGHGGAAHGSAAHGGAGGHGGA